MVYEPETIQYSLPEDLYAEGSPVLFVSAVLKKEKDKEEEDEQRKGRHRAPSTGDTTNILLPAAIALLGVLAIVARRLLKRA